MSQITGRDIYSINEWQTILLAANYVKENRVVIEITDAIIKYHQLEKKKADNIIARKEALSHIEKLCERFVAAREDDLCQKPKGSRKNLEGSIDYWILSLQKKSNHKLQYLNQLESFLATAKPHQINRNEMIEHLKIRNKSNTPSRLKLFSGTYLEKIDPLHRQFEFNMNKLPNKEFGINSAFLDWIASNDTTPFFLWLENHDVLTQNRVSKEKHEINLIDYNLQAAHIATFKNMDGQNYLVSKPQNSDEETVKLNSRQMKNYSFKMGTAYGSTAFVWCKDNENQFLTHPHQAGKFHHSSLSTGKSVRCAGMWVVNNGIITHISNSSGHYRPSSLSFYLLIKFLESKQVINANTRVADLRKPDELVDPSRPFGSTKSQYVPLREYLDWAEQLPEVQEYLQTVNSCNNTSNEQCIIF
ncbi:hypothetical protein LEAN103870_19580 [Legionella anisa]|uniref:Uncharacterized protein n=1 Tax=Legionella anisa TaxID=28082 RepID=A0AAX0WWS6_9GAMM|nr:hypothetical protein [Legionella anisa]AWN73478.1 hypothetical protein DLD14_06275 [Legionella anisa]KTC70781.1 hypothetical protein Lani_2328 [Legionella anisa]MCW8426351.1 hypothetical protein [Legionella anisa]MCW8448011.1 hypothetical protein [Legionella anisa]PNL62610.1 hypothetical protein A6J39_016120 [Legionella anisa]